MGIDIEIKLSEWSQARKNLEAGEIDVISGMVYSIDRKDVVSFSNRHSITVGDIFSYKKHKIHTLEELENQTVAVQKGDIVAEYLASLGMNIKLVEFFTVKEALEEVENGVIKYAGILKLPGLFNIKENSLKKVKSQELNLYPQDYCMAVKKGNEDLLIDINGALKVIQESGELSIIQEKWLGIYQESSFMIFLSKYKYIFILISVVIIMLLASSVILKRLVSLRTKELLVAKKEIETMLKEENSRLQSLVDIKTQELNLTLSELYNKEKLASLGSLVAGISHEINTPLGISVTAASYLLEKHKEITKAINTEKLTKTALSDYLDSIYESSEILLNNLAKASKLIKSFKKISVGQSLEEKIELNLKDCINDTLLMLKHEYKNHNYKFTIDCPDNLILFSYAGAISQIFTNLIINSIKHGFKGKEKGDVKIIVKDSENTIYLDYIDDGKGVKKEIASRIFDPFFTTNRENGGSGLGLCIIYNLVTATLKGAIDFESKEDNGVIFKISFPKEVKNI